MRVGIDLVAVASVEEAIEAHGDHYLTRIYTEHELADCRVDGTVDAERLAGRFAAKEAAMKTLRPGEEAVVPWSSIAVHRRASGWVELELSGPAADLAEQAGIADMSVSLTHERGFAAAVVVAT
ncbi:MAG: holo-[acyl-carrier protein] synthase [Thermoleophilaceae bacterium]|jgi:holo-[acyl-carrier protein] synthase|nr:holo-[acyl-carrier protein] synthase [Thermoleophilaceae bacterium]